jgi:hypothetical protein
MTIRTKNKTRNIFAIGSFFLEGDSAVEDSVGGGWEVCFIF